MATNELAILEEPTFNKLVTAAVIEDVPLRLSILPLGKILAPIQHEAQCTTQDRKVTHLAAITGHDVPS